MKKVLFSSLLILGLAVSFTSAQAQGGPPRLPGGGDVVDVNPNNPTNIPFDGGLSLVAAAGIAYVVKKGHDKRKAKS